MTYQVQTVRNFINEGGPTFPEFLEGLDASALDSFPEAANKTPIQIYNEKSAEFDNLPGLISRSISSNSTSETITCIWEADEYVFPAGNAPQNESNTFHGPFIVNSGPGGEVIDHLKRLYLNQYISSLVITLSRL